MPNPDNWDHKEAKVKAKELKSQAKESGELSFEETEQDIVNSEEFQEFFGSREQGGKHEKKIIGLKYNIESSDDLVHMVNIAKWDREFFEDVVLRHDSHVPIDKIRELSREIKDSQEYTLGKQELEELRKLMKDAETPVEKISDYMQHQKAETITPEEVFGRAPTGTEREMVGMFNTLGISVDNRGLLETVKENPESKESMMRGGFSFVMDKVATAIQKQEDSKGSVLNREEVTELCRELYASDGELITFLRGASSDLREGFDYFASKDTPQKDIFIRSEAFNHPVDYKDMLEKIESGEFDVAKLVETMKTGEGDEVATAEATFKSMIGHHEGDYKAALTENAKGHKQDLIDEVGAPLSKIITKMENTEGKSNIDKAFDGVEKIVNQAAELGEKFQDFVSKPENMERLERIFNLPIVGPMLKERLIGEAAEPGGWYYAAREKFLEAKGGFSPSEAKLFDSYFAEVGADSRRSTTEGGNKDLFTSVRSKGWYKDLGSIEGGEKTQDAVQYFNTEFFAEKILESNYTDDFVGSIPDGDPLRDDRAEIAEGTFLVNTLARQLYGENSELEAKGYYQESEVDSTVASETPAEASGADGEVADAPEVQKEIVRKHETKLVRDINTYTARRLETVIGEHKADIQTSEDVARLLVADLIKQGNDHALEYRSRSYGTAVEKVAEGKKEEPEAPKEQSEVPKETEKPEVEAKPEVEDKDTE